MLEFFKTIFWVASVCALCSCADMGASSSFTNMNNFRSSFSFDGMTMPTMNPRDMHFYMDDDKMAAPVLSNPAYQYLYDPYCGYGCR